jgi:hypothetical protein
MVKGSDHQTKTLLKGSEISLNINSHENETRFLVCKELLQ